MIEHSTGNRKVLGSIPRGVKALLFSQKKLLEYNPLLLHKIEKIKMAGTSHEISSAMDENYDEY